MIMKLIILFVLLGSFVTARNDFSDVEELLSSLKDENTKDPMESLQKQRRDPLFIGDLKEKIKNFFMRSCGSSRYFPLKNQCCNDVIISRFVRCTCVSNDTSGCCSNVPYERASHVCQNGKIVVKECQETIVDGCCNGVSYKLKTHECKDGVVGERSCVSSLVEGCCDGKSYARTTHECKNGEVIKKCKENVFFGCCNGDRYLKRVKSCVNGEVVKKPCKPSQSRGCCNDVSFLKGKYLCLDGKVVSIKSVLSDLLSEIV